MVTVAIFGLEGTGKRTVADMMVQSHGFIKATVVPRLDIAMASISLNNDQKSELSFTDYHQLCEHVTVNWQDNFVIPVVHEVEECVSSALMKRPFVVKMWLTAPSTIRFPRPEDDVFLYGGKVPLCTLLPEMEITLVNNGSMADLSHCLHRHLTPTTLLTHSRPTWDHYFMSLARLAELRSNCMKRRVGAVLVHHNRVLSTGYNGTPRRLPNCNTGGCPRCNHNGSRCGEQLDQCVCLHAEENAVLEATGGQRVEGATVYCTTKPCLGCAKMMVQVGVGRVVWEREYSELHDSEALFERAGVVCEQLRRVPRVIMAA